MSALQHRRVRQRIDKVVYRRRRFAVLGLLFSLVLAAVGWGCYRFWNRPLSASLPEPVTIDTKRFTMLVMGSDDRPGLPGRSDTMMLGFVDLEQGKIELLSIPRDAYVPIPGHGWDKINAAYPYGGVSLVHKTVEQLAGIPIDYTVSVNMAGFEQIVDAVNGVDIDIPANMDYEDPYDTPPLSIHLKKGVQHLYGVDALHYVRFRHDAESDWGRMKRQQQFLQALAKAALQPGNLTKLPQLISLGSQNVTTNLSPAQLTQLAKLAKDKVGADRIGGSTLSGDDIWAPDGYYLGLHFTEMRTKVRELAGITVDDTMKAQDQKDARAYLAGLPEGSSTPAVEAPAPAPAPVPASGKTGGGTGAGGTGAGGTGAGGTGAGGSGGGTPGTGGSKTGTGTGTGTGTKPPTPPPGGGSTTPGNGGKTGTGTGSGTGTGTKPPTTPVTPPPGAPGTGH